MARDEHEQVVGHERAASRGGRDRWPMSVIGDIGCRVGATWIRASTPIVKSIAVHGAG
jgi:hypothetical protein